MLIVLRDVEVFQQKTFKDIHILALFQAIGQILVTSI